MDHEAVKPCPENTYKPVVAYPKGTFGETAWAQLGQVGRAGTRRRAGVGGMVLEHPSSASPKPGSSWFTSAPDFPAISPPTTPRIGRRRDVKCGFPKYWALSISLWARDGHQLVWASLKCNSSSCSFLEKPTNWRQWWKPGWRGTHIWGERVQEQLHHPLEGRVLRGGEGAERWLHFHFCLVFRLLVEGQMDLKKKYSASCFSPLVSAFFFSCLVSLHLFVFPFPAEQGDLIFLNLAEETN